MQWSQENEGAEEKTLNLSTDFSLTKKRNPLVEKNAKERKILPRLLKP